MHIITDKMSAMFVQLILLLIISDFFGTLNAEKLDQGKLPRQLLDLETFVYQKFQDVDRLLIEKDERIDQLQSILTNQKTEIAQLMQGMASLEQDIVHKDGIVDRLVNRVTALETIMMLDTVQQEPESRQETRQSISLINDRLDQFPSPNNGTTSTRQNTISPPSTNRPVESPPFQDFTFYNGTRESLLLQDSMSSSNASDEKLADTSISQPSIVKSESEAKDVPSITFSKPQQKRVASPPSQTIAFHVALSAYHDYHPDNTVVYDNEKLDHGDGYNPGDGIYTVPESGTYVFTWTSICYVHQYFQTILAVNGAYMGSSWTESQDVNDYHQTTAVVVLHLIKGDHVFIRMGSIYGQGRMLSSKDIGESTLSGWKLD